MTSREVRAVHPWNSEHRAPQREGRHWRASTPGEYVTLWLLAHDQC